MASFGVYVQNEDQRGLRGRRVVLSFTSPWRGVTAAALTDADGHAAFDGYEEGQVRIFVDGSAYGTHYYEHGDSVTITL